MNKISEDAIGLPSVTRSKSDSLFGPAATADDVLAGVDLHGRRFFITGVSAGLGVETARALVARGAHVIGAARDLRKAREASACVEAAANAAGGAFDLMALNLASLASIRACTEALWSSDQALDGVIANAGVMTPRLERTTDGFELQFGTNHLGHFVLANRLARILLPGGKLIMISSAGHRFADVNLEDPNFEKTGYDAWSAYGASKTANILFAVEFDRRHAAGGIRAAAVHPGAIRTGLTREITHTEKQELAAMLGGSMQPADYRTVAQGAATSVWAATVADGNAIGGGYCEDCGVAKVQDDPAVRTGVRSYALDNMRAHNLWSLSERLVGERFI